MNPNSNIHHGSASSIFTLQMEMDKMKEDIARKKNISNYVRGGFSLKKRPHDNKQSNEEKKINLEEVEIEEKRLKSFSAMEEKTRRYNEIKNSGIYDEELLVQPDDYNTSYNINDNEQINENNYDMFEENSLKNMYNHDDLYRDYGPCNYSFSKDEMLKGIQQEELRQLSKETLSSREKAKEAAYQRLRDTYQRLVKLYERKNRTIVSFEDYVAENTQYYTSRNDNGSENELSSDGLENEMEKYKRRKKREWDIGKELI
ncbi:Protein of unknown function DUF4078 family-containing protein [Strongyloides ratti]|uniref:Uncharacterized protein n=1 Tax=Strongyloides ratti TaxID=34506 RepID=A0A090LDB5_STRRB|nr:Protein of unknown function DUF4078 family-containing protein [Strongyloides ratti]CEF66128.1 Protein of unknown function DUF4078 family-containing protein [Strongyloides ratti]